MKTQSPEKRLRGFWLDYVKLGFLFSAIACVLAVFWIVPSLSGPVLSSLVIAMLLSPLVAAWERRGHSRNKSIAIVFSGLAVTFAICAASLVRVGTQEWSGFQEKAPENFHRAIQKMREFESSVKAQYPILSSAHPTDSVLSWGERTGNWFVENGPGLMGTFLQWIFFVPFVTFVLLSDGPEIRRGFFVLIPNRYFETFFLVSHQIVSAISDYLRAKLIEAFLVGAMVTFGLFIIGAPYALVLGFAAGITNIIPYAGPVLGAVPGLLVAAFDAAHPGILLPMVVIYGLANLVDTLVIFPVVVAKLVRLHPLVLIVVVMIGQQYYGLIGMLISIPITAALKVVVEQVYANIYMRRAAPQQSTS